MSDIFGIGAAMRAMVRIYLQSARATGRTTAMIESVQSGDRIIFQTVQERDRVKRLLHAAGKKVECKVIPVERSHEAVALGRAPGRTIFDHTWVERFYESAIEESDHHLSALQQRLSHADEQRAITRQAAIELSKWGA